MKDDYFLYVGNAYPHKNVETLIRAAKLAKARVIYVGKNDYFYQKLGVVPKSVSDKELTNLYKNATALVFPSLMEGFGLPGVEAMRIGTPVVCSDIPVFREIYGEACLKFNPRDPEDIKKKLQEVLENKKLRTDLIVKGKKQAAKYSWRRMASETLEVYESSDRV